MAAGVLVGFAVASTVLGLTLALGDGSPTTQQIGFAFYGAGAPVSAVFAAAAGELPLAPFTDLVVWLVLAVAAVRWGERRGRRLGSVLGAVIGLAAAFGAVVSFLIERV